MTLPKVDYFPVEASNNPETRMKSSLRHGYGYPARS